MTGSCSCVDWSGGGDPNSGSGCTFTTKWDTSGVKTVTATPDCGGSKQKQVTVVAVASLLPDEGTEIDDGDGDPDTKSFVVCADPGVVTVTATPNPSVSEEDLPDCWELSGGNGFGKLTRTVYKIPRTATITCTCNTSSKSTTIYVIGGPIESQDLCGEPYGKYLLLANPASESLTDGYSAKSGQPSGTTYKWEISSGATKAHIVGSDTGSTVILKADQEGNFTLKLTYSKGGAGCDSYLATAVQKPNQGNSFITCGNHWYICDPGPPRMEAGCYVNYYVRDGSNRPVPHALWDESWQGGCVTIQEDVRTNCNGHMLDTICGWRPWYCDSRGVICSDSQTIKVEGWPVSGSFWSNTIQFRDGQPPYLWHSFCQ